MNAAFIPLALALLGVICLAISLSWILLSQLAKAWPCTRAILGDHSVEPYVGGKFGEATAYVLKVHYTYRVNDETYSGSRLSFGPKRFDSEPEARDFFSTLTECGTKVRYCPFYPKLATILTSVEPIAPILLSFGIVLLIPFYWAFCD